MFENELDKMLEALFADEDGDDNSGWSYTSIRNHW